MAWVKALKALLGIELLAALFLFTALPQIGQEAASHFQLYELLGVVMASCITTFGLLKMKKLTE